MIGQTENVGYLSSLAELPHFIIVFGPKGSGRKTLLFEEYRRRGLKPMAIDGKVDAIRDAIALATNGSGRFAFVLDSADFSANTAGSLLKITEECPKNAWFSLIAEARNLVLPTLISRGVALQMAPYSQAEYEEYAQSLAQYGATKEDVDRASQYCGTFGDMFSMVALPDKGASLAAFAEKVVDNILNVSLENALLIPQSIGMRGETDKHNPSLFLSAVLAKISTMPSHPVTLRMARATAKARGLLANKGLNKQMVFDQWIMEMRGEPRWN